MNSINKNHLSNSTFIAKPSPHPGLCTACRAPRPTILDFKCQTDEKCTILVQTWQEVESALSSQPQHQCCSFISQVNWEHVHVSNTSSCWLTAQTHRSSAHSGWTDEARFQTAASTSIIAVCLHAVFQSWKMSFLYISPVATMIVLDRKTQSDPSQAASVVSEEKVPLKNLDRHHQRHAPVSKGGCRSRAVDYLTHSYSCISLAHSSWDWF